MLRSRDLRRENYFLKISRAYVHARTPPRFYSELLLLSLGVYNLYVITSSDNNDSETET